MFNIYNLYNWTAGSFPDRPSVIYHDKIYTFRDMSQRINRLASSLYRLGIRPQETVGMLMKNDVDFLTVFYAAHKLGVILIPLNWRLKIDCQIEHIRISKCKYLIYDADMAENVAQIKAQMPDIALYISHGEAEKEELSALIDSGDPNWEFDPHVKAEDPALYLLTGGTSSNSKVAVATQEKMVLRALLPALYHTLDYTPQDNFLLFNPMFHFGGLGIYLPCSIAGGCITLMDRMDVEEMLKTIEKYRITRILLLPPALCHRIKASPELQKYDLSSITHVMLAGGASSEKLTSMVFDTFPNTKVYTCYGATEFAAETNVTFTREEYAANPKIASSVGKRAPFTYIKLVDEDGNEVGPNTPGECYGRSICMMNGYMGRPSPFIDGWYPSNDCLEYDEDGYYYFRDRKNFMVKSGGENVLPVEVEAVINMHPKVQKSAVFGIPDEELGEIIAAAVVLNPGENLTEEELIAFTREHISHYKKPRRVFFFDELCYTTVGKVDKRALRELCLKLEKQTYSEAQK